MTSRSRLGGLLALCGIVFAVSSLTAPFASADVTLYDQTTGTPGGFLTQGVVTTPCKPPTFMQPGCVFTEYISPNAVAADDFTVPVDQAWYVKSVDVDGRGGAGDHFFWRTVSATGSLPPEEAIFASGPESGGSNATARAPSGADDFAIPADPGHPTDGVGLLPGHYWLEVWAGKPEPDGAIRGHDTPWEWQAQSPQAGYEAVVTNSHPSTDPTWKALSEAGQPGPDLRFSIVGESLLGSLAFGRRIRRPAGGLLVVATIPGPGELALRKLSGPGKVETSSCCFAAKADGGYTALLKVKPLGKTKELLKAGKKLKEKIAITYTRIATTNHVAAPPIVKRISVTLQRPNAGRKK